MHITPAMMEGAYNFLLTTPPFRGWKLPDADDVVFIVLRTDRFNADHYFKDGRHHIRASQRAHQSPFTLLATVAHEICHIKDYPAKAHHGASFKRLADLVCRHHPFDRGQF